MRCTFCAVHRGVDWGWRRSLCARSRTSNGGAACGRSALRKPPVTSELMAQPLACSMFFRLLHFYRGQVHVRSRDRNYSLQNKAPRHTRTSDLLHLVPMSGPGGADAACPFISPSISDALDLHELIHTRLCIFRAFVAFARVSPSGRRNLSWTGNLGRLGARAFSAPAWLQ